MSKAYLVLLNGVRSPDELSPGSILRMDRLLEIAAAPGDESWIICSSGYSRSRPPMLDRHGLPVLEARVAAHYLIARGIARSRILTEEASTETIGNIYFSLKLLIEPLQLRDLVLVTSEFHMERVKACMEWMRNLPGWAVTPAVTYEAAPNIYRSPELLQQRLAKEALGVENIHRLAERIRNVEQLCLWLHREHNGYRFDGEFRPAPIL